MNNIKKKYLQVRDFLNTNYSKIAEIRYVEFENMVTSLYPHVGSLENKRILDVGCGRYFPFTLMLQNMNTKVTGIDISYINTDVSFVRKYWNVLRQNGFDSFVVSVLSLIFLKNYHFYRTLERLFGRKLFKDEIDLKTMNAEELEFNDSTFDVAMSFTVFEHLPDVRKVASELKRVLKPNGIAYIAIHVYTSLGGGHHLEWRNFDKVPPWDHLREMSLPLTCYLNKLRKKDYEVIFNEYFEIIEQKDLELDVTKEVARELLTESMRSQLMTYSEEELITHGTIFILKNKRCEC